MHDAYHTDPTFFDNPAIMHALQSYSKTLNLLIEQWPPEKILARLQELYSKLVGNNALNNKSVTGKIEHYIENIYASYYDSKRVVTLIHNIYNQTGDAR